MMINENSLLSKTKRMEEWIKGFCDCPCCGELEQCLEGCTFAEDCPNEAELMRDARDLLYGD
jgi:hypothetical protein